MWPGEKRRLRRVWKEQGEEFISSSSSSMLLFFKFFFFAETRPQNAAILIRPDKKNMLLLTDVQIPNLIIAGRNGSECNYEDIATTLPFSLFFFVSNYLIL